MRKFNAYIDIRLLYLREKQDASMSQPPPLLHLMKTARLHWSFWNGSPTAYFLRKKHGGCPITALARQLAGLTLDGPLARSRIQYTSISNIVPKSRLWIQRSTYRGPFFWMRSIPSLLPLVSPTYQPRNSEKTNGQVARLHRLPVSFDQLRKMKQTFQVSGSTMPYRTTRAS